MSITAERLRELLEYSPETGLFVWKKFTNGRVLVGSKAGCIVKKRYATICIDEKTYLAHRLAWLYVHGEWPKGWIDHINRDKRDNRIENLRDVTPSQSAWNRAGDKGRSLPKGVYKKKYGFESWIMRSGKNHYLGHFRTEAEAVAVRVAAASELHGAFAYRGG